MNLLHRAGEAVALSDCPLLALLSAFNLSLAPEILEVAVGPLEQEVVVFPILHREEEVDDVFVLLQLGTGL